jgi:hypothetical protein
MRGLVLAVLLSGCANISPHAGLCDTPVPAANFAAPNTLPSLRDPTGGCWFLGLTAKV